MRNIQGNNTVEYMLPILLAGLIVCVGIIGLSETGLFDNFFAQSVTGKVEGSKIVINSNSTVASANWVSSTTPPIGTPSKPVLKCNNVVCILDFGTFTIPGLPSGFIYDPEKGLPPGFLGGTPQSPVKLCSANGQFCITDTGDELIFPSGIDMGGCVYWKNPDWLPSDGKIDIGQFGGN